MVELAGLSEAALLPNTVVGALDIEITGGSALDELIAGLAPKAMLLVWPLAQVNMKFRPSFVIPVSSHLTPS